MVLLNTMANNLCVSGKVGHNSFERSCRGHQPNGLELRAAPRSEAEWGAARPRLLHPKSRNGPGPPVQAPKVMGLQRVVGRRKAIDRDSAHCLLRLVRRAWGLMSAPLQRQVCATVGALRAGWANPSHLASTRGGSTLGAGARQPLISAGPFEGGRDRKHRWLRYRSRDLLRRLGWHPGRILKCVRSVPLQEGFKDDTQPYQQQYPWPPSIGPGQDREPDKPNQCMNSSPGAYEFPFAVGGTHVRVPSFYDLGECQTNRAPSCQTCSVGYRDAVRAPRQNGSRCLRPTASSFAQHPGAKRSGERPGQHSFIRYRGTGRVRLSQHRR
jgi:hypothetical protein